MQTKFTPGPWYISMNDNYVRAESSKGWNIAKIEDQPPYKEANARLIAAAPEMYKILDLLDDDPGLPVWVRQRIKATLNRINQ